MDNDALRSFLLAAPVLLFSVVAHEYAHGYAALREGDATAYSLGRLTLNPIKHIDPFMTIILPVLLWLGGGPIVGGAKPVPVNPRNFRRYRRGDIIVSLAGVAVNLVLALAFTALTALVGLLGAAAPALEPTLAILQAMLILGIFINLALIAFNLIPIPPLDGSHVMKYLLPPAWSLGYQRFAQYGVLILILLLWLPGNVLGWWMGPAYRAANGLVGAVWDTVLPGTRGLLR